jgi:hypothetical protein
VTLTMTIVAPWGVWQCSDHRVTWLEWDTRLRRWRVHDPEDHSMKHVMVRCRDGTALITYSGLGMVGRRNNADHVSDWLRRLIRGDNQRTVDQTLVRISEGATAKFAKPLRQHSLEHTFVVGAVFIQRRPPLAAEITNAQGPPGLRPLDRFVVRTYPADQEPQKLIRGKGQEAISQKDRALLERITHHRPARLKDYSQVLADIHRRAKHSKHPASETISEGCVTTFMPPRDYGFETDCRAETGTHWSAPDVELALPPSPFVFLGIDYTEIFKVLLDDLRAMEAGQPLDPESTEAFRQAFQRAIEPPTP